MADKIYVKKSTNHRFALYQDSKIDKVNGSCKLPVKIRRSLPTHVLIHKTTPNGAITHVIAVREHVYLLTVFDKSEKDNISDKELQELLKMIE